ncbi:hypothetical protein [uncultured Croceitalea sp.]|uniref:hypothetical protein n=1 Tax=uncultured Croceitalea sp. TaxID=1798908 RepID=UPI003306275C
MDTISQLHFAAQYLATAAKSFLVAKDDDSHTNIGFSIASKRLQTRSLTDNGLLLSLNLMDFSLEWNSQKTEPLVLNDKTHSDVTDWLRRTSVLLEFKKPYQFDLHYELPFAIEDTFIFKSLQNEALEDFFTTRSIAQKAIQSFLEEESLVSEIRIWPHHFDLGAFATISDTKKSVGVGLAVADTVVPQTYFYISGYQNNAPIDPTRLDTLTLGKWKNNTFKGGVLSAQKVTEKMAVTFLKQAFHALK